jgi:hypothetical protein
VSGERVFQPYLEGIHMGRLVLLLALPGLFALAGCANDIAKNNQALAKFQNGDCKAAASDWLPMANRGIAAAQNNMGGIFEKGCPSAGIPQDYAKAFHWYSLAAKSGYPMGMRNLGWYYQHGLSVMHNDAVARDWYTTAARWGNERAKRDLEAMGVPVPPPDLYNNAIKEQQEAEANRAEKRQEIFDDTVAVLLGAALGVSASHNQATPPATYGGAFTGSSGARTNDAPNTSSYHGAFSRQQTAPASSGPITTFGSISGPSGTSTLHTVGNTTYVTNPDGTTSGIIEKTERANYGHDPRTGRQWTEIRDGDSWFGSDTKGRTWTRRKVGDTEVLTYSDGTTTTCRVADDQLVCS